jgi:hypothetical protein
VEEIKMYYQCDECGKLGLGKWGGMRGSTLYIPDGFHYKNPDSRIAKRYRGIICDKCLSAKKKYSGK